MRPAIASSLCSAIIACTPTGVDIIPLLWLARGTSLATGLSDSRTVDMPHTLQCTLMWKSSHVGLFCSGK